MKYLVLAPLLVSLVAPHLFAADTNAASSRLLRPLSLAEALDLALQQNSAIRKSAADLEATYGVVAQTRAVALPRVTIGSSYSANEDTSIDRFKTSGTNAAFANAFEFADQRWSADIRIVQSIYEGGRIRSALRSARLTRDQAVANHQTIIADALRDVRVAYYAALLAQQQLIVQEASLKLLQEELGETTKRFDAGTVPRFNVLRAEVEVANARPRVIRARNAVRVSKDNLANLIGENIPQGTDELALTLTDKLETAPYEVQLSAAIAQALGGRTELTALRLAERLRADQIKTAKSGYKPSVQLFAGYGTKSSQFSQDLTEELHGWEAGAQLSWNVFDGFLTQGRVQEAEALRRRAEADIEDATRRVELDVRMSYSTFVEAREVLISQEKVQESAEESLRLANARAAAGAGTQLDVLSAQTALTEARTTQVQAKHDYAVARARLERAIGQPIATGTNASVGPAAPSR
jgi:outer membrane protein